MMKLLRRSILLNATIAAVAAGHYAPCAADEAAPSDRTRASLVDACTRLVDPGKSPFPFPGQRVAATCGCAGGRLESNDRVLKLGWAISKGEPPTNDSDRSYFVAKLVAAVLSCFGDDLDKIADEEGQLKRPEVGTWLDLVTSSVPAVWPADNENVHSPKILVPNPDEAKRGKGGCLKPAYPVLALRKEVTGTVTLAYLVDASGHVAKTRVLHSSGETPIHKLLDATAAAYIGDCEFRPGTVNDVPVQSWARIQYVWKIE